MGHIATKLSSAVKILKIGASGVYSVAALLFPHVTKLHHYTTTDAMEGIMALISILFSGYVNALMLEKRQSDLEEKI